MLCFCVSALIAVGMCVRAPCKLCAVTEVVLFGSPVIYQGMTRCTQPDNGTIALRIWRIQMSVLSQASSTRNSPVVHKSSHPGVRPCSRSMCDAMPSVNAIRAASSH